MMHVLIVESMETDFGKVMLDKVKVFLEKSFHVIVCRSLGDARLVIKANISLCALLLSKIQKADSTCKAEEELIDFLQKRQPNVPSFFLNENPEADVPAAFVIKCNEILFISQDSVEFIGGRIVHFAETYLENLLPSFTDDMRKFARIHEYSWTIPGHQGVGMKKSPVGKAFVDFVGENIFKIDLNSSRTPLGSLLGHSGSFLQSEKEIAEIFGAEFTYNGVAGGSGSNRTVMQYCIKEEDEVLIDRNCHKSVAHGLILTGGTAKFLIPSRNQFGMIGPFRSSDLAKMTAGPKQVPYFVMTNCTFDGIIYSDVKKIEDILAKNVKYVHFDEAWYAYARFHPLFANTYSMRGAHKDYKGKPTVFATHSTHKMLNAFGQGSFIHARTGTAHKFDPDEFNQAYMMHTTTSPSYILATSNDVAASMMRGEMGTSLVEESLVEAIHFRKALSHIYSDAIDKGDDWFFKVWNIEKIGVTKFHEIGTDDLIKNQKYWVLDPKDKWHGFDDLKEESWCMLDPLKVTIVTKVEGISIPAPLLTVYLASKGVTICRNTEYTIMFLFSLGVTKGKWITLVHYLLEFKKYYDNNSPMREVLPEFVATNKKYESAGLKDLGNEMNEFLSLPENNLSVLQNQAFAKIPESVMSSRAAFNHMTVNSEYVPLDQLVGRISVSFVIPYPPGIPIIISGEKFGEDAVAYLKALEHFDQKFPGFEHETTGVKKIDDGTFSICVVKNKK